MAKTAHPKSSAFAALSKAEKARRISGIADKGKRERAAKYWGVSSEWKSPVARRKYAPPDPTKEKGNFFERALEDIPKLGKGIYKEGKAWGGGLAEDVEKGRGLPGATRYVAQRASPFAVPLLGLEKAGLISAPKGPWAHKKLDPHKWDPSIENPDGSKGAFIDERESAMNRLGRTVAKELPGQLAQLKDPMAWYNDPLIQLMNLGSIVVPGVRVASVARLSRTFKAANPGMSISQANKAGLIESLNPGMMAAHGVKGGIKPRIIQGEHATARGRMPSRGPIPRAGQRAIDRASEWRDRQNPNARFSASRRAAARNRKLDDAAVKRQAAADKQRVDEVIKILTPSKTGRAKQALGLGGKQNEARAAALIASLESPENLTVAEAADLRVRVKEHILEENEEFRTRQDEVNSLQAERDRLADERRRAAEEAEVEGEEFDGTAHDEQIAELDTQIRNKGDAIEQDLGRAINPVVGSGVRASVMAAMRKSLGKEKANEAIKAWDAVARAQSPDDPAAWYATRIEGARVAKADSFQPAGEVLFRQAPPTEAHRTPLPGEGPIRQEEMGFHSTLVETLVKQDPERVVQSGKMRATLEKAGVTPIEMRNAGLGDLLDSRPSVTAQEVIDHLVGRTYAHVFYPHVEVRSDALASTSSYGAAPGPDRVEWGPFSNPELNSRHGQPGEYHEATISLPEHWAGSDTSMSHWNDPRVVYHIRYQIFEENDQTVMLIEEIQSDWASDFRKARKEGKHEREPGEEEPVVAPAAKKAEDEARLRDLREYLAEEKEELDDQSKKILQAVKEGIDEQDEDFLEALDREMDLRDNVASFEAQIRALESGAAGQNRAEVVRLTQEWNQARDRLMDAQGRFDLIDESLEGVDPASDVEGFRRLEEARQEQDAAGAHLSELSEQLNQRGGPQLQARSPMGLDEKYLRNAIHTIMRIADDEGVDTIVLTDGTTQALRNGKGDMGVDEGVDITTHPFDSDDMDDLPGDLEDGPDQFVEPPDEDYGQYIDRETREPLTNEQIFRILKEQEGKVDEVGVMLGGEVRGKGQLVLGTFPNLYGKSIPNLWKKLYPVDPQRSPNAYTGRYTGQVGPGDYSSWEGYVQKGDGPMPGTVIHLTEEALEKARESAPMYRRNWEGVPQGASELLEDGRFRVTMFETANVSTWMHELAHVAVRDLSPDDIATLEHQIADGRKLEDWTEADHEKYARSFETYLRTGKAHPALQEIFKKVTEWMKKLWYEIGPEGEQVSPETADVFDRLLGKRYQNTTILDDAEIAQVRAEIKNLRDALDDPESMDHAADALAALAEEAERTGIEIMRRNWKSEAQEAAGLAGIARRKNAIVEDYRRRGFIGPGEEARGYFPNMSMWEALGQPQVQPSRLGATGQTVGTPRVTGKAVMKKRNRLIRYQRGEVLNDPTAVIYILRARQRILATVRAREELYATGQPIEEARAAPNWNPDQVVFVRNPDKTPETMHKATEAMGNLSREDFTRLQKRRELEVADEIDGVKQVKDEMLWDGSRSAKEQVPDWVKSEENVRVVSLGVARNRVGDVFSSAPKGKTMAALGVLNSMARAASIYLPLGGARYVFRNWIQNAVIMAATQPSAFAKLIGDNGRALHKRDPVLYNRLNEEFGTIQAQALPEYNTRPQGRMQRIERNSNRISGQIGEQLGRFADVPLRMASLRRHAERYGFRTDKELYELLDRPELDEIRETISQRTREDMIDFDALTPYEKEVLTRYLFIWPFIRGATKWPFMYAREYPGRLAAASLTTNALSQEDASGDVTAQLKGKLKVPFLGEQTFDFNWLNPAGPALENAQRLDDLIKRNARREYTLKPLITESLAPQYRFLLDLLTGDLGNDPEAKLASTFIPGFTTGEAAKGGGLKGLVEFSTRTFGLQTDSRSIKRETNEWTSEVDAIVKWVDESGAKLDPATIARLEKMKVAYADWTSSSKRAEWEGATQANDSLSKAKRAALILEIAAEHYPEVYGAMDQSATAAGWDSIEEVVAATDDDEFLDSVYEKTRDLMFGLKEDLARDAKKAGYKA